MDNLIPRRGPGAARTAHVGVSVPRPAFVGGGSTNQKDTHWNGEPCPGKMAVAPRSRTVLQLFASTTGSWATIGGVGLKGDEGKPFIARSPTTALPSSRSTLTDPAV
jgi:hypothetical protein